MLERLNDYDWQEAFSYAGSRGKVSCVHGWEGDASPFLRDDVAEILAIDNGENDGPNWIGLFLLKDGRYAFLSAGCDYTGWDCQAGGDAIVGPTKEDMVRLALGEDDRARLKL